MSNFLKINWADVGKGLLLAVLSSVISGIYTIIDKGAFPTLEDFKVIGLIALGTALSYLLKNVFTNSDGKIMTPENK